MLRLFSFFEKDFGGKKNENASVLWSLRLATEFLSPIKNIVRWTDTVKVSVSDSTTLSTTQ
jgi:hypothetical protein